VPSTGTLESQGRQPWQLWAVYFTAAVVKSCPLNSPCVWGEDVYTKETVTVGRSRGRLAPWQAKGVAGYISAHLGGRIRAPDLAELVSLSTSHFFRAFRKTFGVAPMAYVARQRVLYAQALLLGSEETLSQVALACGSCDQAHFTRMFRRVVGLTPGAWREQLVESSRLRMTGESHAARRSTTIENVRLRA
jgi:AraC-like DNA-binding protein